MLRFPFALLMSSTGIVKLQIYANLTSFEMHLPFWQPWIKDMIKLIYDWSLTWSCFMIWSHYYYLCIWNHLLEAIIDSVNVLYFHLVLKVVKNTLCSFIHIYSCSGTHTFFDKSIFISYLSYFSLRFAATFVMWERCKIKCTLDIIIFHFLQISASSSSQY